MIDHSTTFTKTVRVGTIPVYDPNTGELYDAAAVTEEVKDRDFEKVWFAPFLLRIELLGTAKLSFAFWLIQQKDKNNAIRMTQKMMMEQSGASRSTVKRVLGILMDCDFIRRQGYGVYVINPNLVWNGRSPLRRAQVRIYQELNHQPLKTEQKLSNVRSQIRALQKQASELENELKTEADTKEKVA